MTITKLAYFILAWVSLLLGLLGIVLPLLPTTPFILLAAFGFSKSSERFHVWLLEHRVFGPMILDWQTNGVIKRNVKWCATLSIFIMLSISFYFLTLPKIAIIAIFACIAGVLLFIWSRPSMPEQS